MPERGRPAASSGNAYQDVRAASCLIDLLEDVSVTSVAVETLDEIDDLVVRRVGRAARYEQVKERAPGGRWTAQRLNDQGVLRQFLRQHRVEPSGEFVLFTGSDASDLREVVDRARNAYGNHPHDEPGRQAALTEWKRRLKGRCRFVDQLLSRIPTEGRQHTLTWQDLQELLARVRVLDAQGTIDQLRERNVQRLRPLVTDPPRAFNTLERLARDAAICRGVIGRSDVEASLTRDGSGPHFAAFALSIDESAYADKIQGESAAVDVAQLPPLVPHFDSPSGLSFSLDAVRGRVLLVGGHGAGKSRIAAELAVKSIRGKRRCLHVRLARWATTLGDLLLAELSRAAASHARAADVDHFLRDAAVLVFDGLDEVPMVRRLTAEREIIQLADSYPHLDILVTCRPGSGRELSREWSAISLCSLSDEQVESTLGRSLHALDLASPIIALAGNPLMLGLLVRRVSDGERPTSEADLLDAFIAEIVERQSRRVPTIDGTSGRRIAEDAAFEWLSSGRVGLGEDEFRNMAATVARDLTRAALLQTDGTQIEHWLIEAGLGVRLGADVVPVHRAVLDHLAARSMARRDPIRSAGLPELREAVARYLGSQREVSKRMLSVLDAVGTDLELLARGKRLCSRDIVWPFESTRFATEYLAELRRLGGGPLFDVGVVGRSIGIEIDRELTWIAERDRQASGDAVTIVAVPSRVYMSGPDGSHQMPVQAFKTRGYRGAEIDIRVPHFAAFARAGEELQTLARQRSLPQEGPDIVYERLCSLAALFIRTVTRVGQGEYGEYSESDFRGLTASGLLAQFWRHAEVTTGEEVLGSGTFIAFVPSSREVVVGTGPEAVVGDPRFSLGVHSATVERLVRQAVGLGIEERPLHPLGLLPDSERDRVLSLPGFPHLLRGDSLGLYIQRHEIGQIRAFRYLVEHNVRGLARFLRAFSTLPWRVDLAFEVLSTRGTFDVRIEAAVGRHAAGDEVRIVPKLEEAWTRWSSIHAYEGVMKGAYDLVEQDVNELLSGEWPLGSDVL